MILSSNTYRTYRFPSTWILIRSHWMNEWMVPCFGWGVLWNWPLPLYWCGFIEVYIGERGTAPTEHQSIWKGVLYERDKTTGLFLLLYLLLFIDKEQQRLKCANSATHLHDWLAWRMCNFFPLEVVLFHPLQKHCINFRSIP